MLGVRIVGLASLRRGATAAALLAVLVAVVVAVVLASVAGARRTLSSVDRMEDAVHAADVEIQLSGDVDALAAVNDLDELVTASGGITLPFFAPEGLGVMPGIEFYVAAPTGGAGGPVDLPFLREGTRPDPGDPTQVAVNSLASERFGFEVGDRITLRALSNEQFDTVVESGVLPESLDGATADVVVTGIADGRRDLFIPEQFGPGMWATPAFAERYATDEVPHYGPLVLAQLADGVDPGEVSAALSELDGLEEPPDVQSAADSADQARSAARFQAGGLLALAAVVGMGGALLVVQAMDRQLQVVAGDGPALLAIGLSRRQRRFASAVPLLVATGAGVTAGIVVASLASGAFPLRDLRALEPSPGIVIDGPVLLVGVLVLGVGLAAAWWRTGRALSLRAAPTRPSVIDRAVHPGSPTTIVGLHLAFGRRPASVSPSRLGVLGVAVATGGAIAAATFAASLTDLRADPSAYGWNWDSEVTSGDDPEQLEPVVDALLADERVAAVTNAKIVGVATVDGRDVQAFAFESLAGPPIFLTMLDGRSPATGDEVVLGPATAERAGVGVGDVIEATARTGAPTPFRVVGIGIFPVLETDAYRVGAAFTPQGLAGLRTTEGYDSVLVDWDEDVDVAAVEAELREQGLGFEPGVPPAVDNLDEVAGFPAVVAALLGVVGMAAFVHALAAGSRTRRRDFAVLQTVGFRRSQLLGALGVHALAWTAVGVVAGVVLGAAAGRTAWRAMAQSIDVLAETRVPALAVVLTVVAATVVAAAATLVPAGRLRRQRPGAVLRSG